MCVCGYGGMNVDGAGLDRGLLCGGPHSSGGRTECGMGLMLQNHTQIAPNHFFGLYLAGQVEEWGGARGDEAWGQVV